jgi:hypothetical protein
MIMNFFLSALFISVEYPYAFFGLDGFCILVLITEIVCEGKGKKLQLALMYNWNWTALCVLFATCKLTGRFSDDSNLDYCLLCGNWPLFLTAGAVGLWLWILHHC